MTKPIPVGILRTLIAATLILTVVTAASNIGHGYNLARYAGQTEKLATLAAVVPDVLIAVALTVLAFRHTNVWAWAALTSAIGFVGWAAVVTSLPGFCLPSAGQCAAEVSNASTRVLVAVWPLLAAVLVAGVLASLLHDRADIATVTRADTGPDITRDTEVDADLDTDEDTAGDTGLLADPDTDQGETAENPQVNPDVIPFTGRKGRVVAAVIDRTMTQAEAARRMKVTPKTIQRWVATAKEARADTEATG